MSGEIENEETRGEAARCERLNWKHVRRGALIWSSIEPHPQLQVPLFPAATTGSDINVDFPGI